MQFLTRSPIDDDISERPPPNDLDEGSLDLRAIARRLLRGFYQTLAFALLGIALAGVAAWLMSSRRTVEMSARFVLSFPGLERGEYPDRSKFTPDDLRAPAVILESLRRLGLPLHNDLQSRIRGKISVEGLIPAQIVKERDRLRAAGQTPPLYIPDEYRLSLSTTAADGLSANESAKLLAEIITVYRQEFARRFGQPPVALGSAFQTLKSADFPEYELVLTAELENVRNYLREIADQAKGFRSPTTNLSFKDLLEQTEMFAQIQMNETLGYIHEKGITRNRSAALTKMAYHLRRLEEREKKAIEEERLIRELLNEAQTRTQNYVLGLKSQSKTDSAVLDQGLIDSLLAHDSYNFLVRRALDAGLLVKGIQAEKSRLLAQRDSMKAFGEQVSTNEESMAHAMKALEDLAKSYDLLVTNIRQTHSDYAQHRFSDAVRASDQVRRDSPLRYLVLACIVGCILGVCLGSGLSILGVYLNRRPQSWRVPAVPRG